MEREEFHEGATILSCGQEKTYLIEISKGVLITAYQFLVKGKSPVCCRCFDLTEKDLWAKRLWKKSKTK